MMHRRTTVIFVVLIAIFEEGSSVIGGRQLTEGEVPYQLGLQSNKKSERTYHCGAVLLEVDGIQIGLTSASCGQSGNLSVMAGDITQSSLDTTLYRRVSKEVIHHYSDLAVLFFIPFETDDHIKPISLPDPDMEVTEGNVTFSGFGSRTWGQPPLPFYASLTAINQTVISLEDCKLVYTGTNLSIANNMFCANIENTGPAMGDEGGPAVDQDGDLVGIYQTRYGLEYPSVFLKVSDYVDWIVHTVEDYKYPEGRPAPCPTQTKPEILSSGNATMPNYILTLIIVFCVVSIRSVQR